MHWKVKKEESGMTLGSFIKSKLGEASTSRLIKAALEKGAASINGIQERFSSTRVYAGANVFFNHLSQSDAIQFDPSLVLFEDEVLFAYNKPSHVTSESLNTLLKSHIPSIHAVHRLDKETSGVMLFAKTEEVGVMLEDLFKKREIHKCYLAVVDGLTEDEGVITNQLGLKRKVHGKSIYGAVPGGQFAETVWRCKQKGATASLIYCYPKTGRTHQIRVHLSGIGHPIIGDMQYGKNFKAKVKTSRMLLHALQLVFLHPVTKKKIVIKAPIPEEFLKPCKTLFGAS